MIAARADLSMRPTHEGGLTTLMDTPCRSLLMHIDGGPGLDPTLLGLIISSPTGAPLSPGASVHDARLDFWVDLAELYVLPGQAFELRYPTRVVGTGLITAVFVAGH